MTTDINSSCCFTGHRDIPAEVYDSLSHRLELEIHWLIAHGVNNFYTGGALGFDTLAALEVIRARSMDDSVRLHLILPCPEQAKYWKAEEYSLYERIKEAADTCRFISPYYHKGVMPLRNRALVDASSYCLYYYNEMLVNPSQRQHSGTLYTVCYAAKKGLTMANLCDVPPEGIQLPTEIFTE